MGLLTFVGRIVLVVLNIIFIILSLTLVALGFFLRFAKDTLQSLIQGALNQVKAAAGDVYGDNLDVSNLDLGKIFGTVAIVLIVVGVFLLAMSFLGCCGACCNFTTVMLVYSIILIVLLLAQVIMVILIFGVPETMKKQLRTAMNGTLDNYEGITGSNIESLAWSFAMQQFDCCGPEDYQDFLYTGGTWKDNDKPSGFSGELLTPLACCKILPDTVSGIGECAGDTTHTLTAIAPKSNYDVSCVEKIWEFIVTSNTVYFFMVVGICFACQLALIIFAFLIYKDRGISGGLV